MDRLYIISTEVVERSPPIFVEFISLVLRTNTKNCAF